MRWKKRNRGKDGGGGGAGGEKKKHKEDPAAQGTEELDGDATYSHSICIDSLKLAPMDAPLDACVERFTCHGCAKSFRHLCPSCFTLHPSLVINSAPHVAAHMFPEETSDPQAHVPSTAEAPLSSPYPNLHITSVLKSHLPSIDTLPVPNLHIIRHGHDKLLKSSVGALKLLCPWYYQHHVVSSSACSQEDEKKRVEEEEKGGGGGGGGGEGGKSTGREIVSREWSKCGTKEGSKNDKDRRTEEGRHPRSQSSSSSCEASKSKLLPWVTMTDFDPHVHRPTIAEGTKRIVAPSKDLPTPSAAGALGEDATTNKNWDQRRRLPDPRIWRQLLDPGEDVRRTLLRSSSRREEEGREARKDEKRYSTARKEEEERGKREEGSARKEERDNGKGGKEESCSPSPLATFNSALSDDDILASTVILYPCEDAVSVSEIDWSTVRSVVLIDSTWFQTDQILAQLPLERLRKVKIEGKKTLFWRHHGRYETNVRNLTEQHLSTVEAAYFLLKEVYEARTHSTYDGRFDNLLYFFVHQYKLIQSVYKAKQKDFRHKSTWLKDTEQEDEDKEKKREEC